MKRKKSKILKLNYIYYKTRVYYKYYRNYYRARTKEYTKIEV